MASKLFFRFIASKVFRFSNALALAAIMAFLLTGGGALFFRFKTGGGPPAITIDIIDMDLDTLITGGADIRPGGDVEEGAVAVSEPGATTSPVWSLIFMVIRELANAGVLVGFFRLPKRAEALNETFFLLGLVGFLAGLVGVVVGLVVGLVVVLVVGLVAAAALACQGWAVV